MVLAVLRRLLLCFKGLREVVEWACREGVEVPVDVLGVAEGGRGWGRLFVARCNVAEERDRRFRIDVHSLYRAVVPGQRAWARHCCDSA